MITAISLDVTETALLFFLSSGITALRETSMSPKK